MKVAFIGHLGEVSGSGMAMLQWAALCQANGWECCLAFPEGPIHERAAELGIKPSIYPLERGNLNNGGLKSFFENRRQARRFITEWLRVEAPDWVVVHSSANVAAASAIRASGVPCLWHIHEEFHGTWGIRQRLKRWEILRTARRLAFASSTGLSNFKPGTIPSLLLRNPLENLHELLDLERHPVQPPMILFNGTSHRKGIDRFINALKLLNENSPDLQWQAVVLGDVSDSGRRQDMLNEQTEPTNRLQFVGVVSREQMMKLYKESSLVVSASRLESRPIFLVEALAAGIPVVATDTGDCAELLGHGTRGKLVGAKNAAHNELAAAIAEMLKAGNHVSLKSAQQEIATEYDPVKIFNSLSELLKT